jgi:hypothetical protein
MRVTIIVIQSKKPQRKRTSSMQRLGFQIVMRSLDVHQRSWLRYELMCEPVIPLYSVCVYVHDFTDLTDSNAFWQATR